MTAMAMIPGVLSQDARTYFEELLDAHKDLVQQS
jgi:hypothetical protein